MRYRSNGKVVGTVGMLIIPTFIGALLLKWQGELLMLKDKFGTILTLFICCMLGLAALAVIGVIGMLIFGGRHG